MTTKATGSTAGTGATASNVSEMEAAAALILKHEEMRHKKVRKRARLRRRVRRQEDRKAIQKMRESVEVIKWCVVAICTVWLISFIISIVVLIRVQGRVAEIEGQVQHIRRVMDNPIANAGARLGGQVDERLKEYLGLPNLGADEE